MGLQYLVAPEYYKHIDSFEDVRTRRGTRSFDIFQSKKNDSDGRSFLVVKQGSPDLTLDGLHGRHRSQSDH